MKKRIGFVSNSSSSSFMLKKEYASEHQLELIRNHSTKGADFGVEYSDDCWTITENEYCIEGKTWMDNFDMDEFLTRIGIKDGVEWSD